MSTQIYISHRCSEEHRQAKLIYIELTKRGYSTFFDYDGMQGVKNTNGIEICSDFILLLSPSSLERCSDPGDEIRLSILHAINHKKNIIPVLLDGCCLHGRVPDGISRIEQLGTVNYSDQNVEAMMNGIIGRLTCSPDGCRYTRIIYSLETGECLIEEEPRESHGLEIRANIFGKTCGVASLGVCRDDNIVIPKMHNGRPVTAIEDGAFEGGGRGNLIMQEGITRIGKNAFYHSGFVSIRVPRSVKKIESGAFADCYLLKEIIYNGSRDEWNRLDKPASLFGGKCWDLPTIKFLSHKVIEPTRF